VARLAHRLALLVAVVVASVTLSACGTGGAVADARASCRYVGHALTLQHQSQRPGLSSSRRAILEANAISELLKATPLASRATSIDGSWNPLMTTINEAERVPLANLVASLTRLCKVANSSTPYL
jgi:lipid A disaccharide synthetase